MRICHSRDVSNQAVRTHMAKLNVNGKVHEVEVENDTPLLWVIREQVGLTGTKYGCEVAQCGACSVHINGKVRRSCSVPVGGVKASDRIVTIEGPSTSSSHPVQRAWAALDVPQCGHRHTVPGGRRISRVICFVPATPLTV